MKETSSFGLLLTKTDMSKLSLSYKIKITQMKVNDYITRILVGGKKKKKRK